MSSPPSYAVEPAFSGLLTRRLRDPAGSVVVGAVLASGGHEAALRPQRNPALVTASGFWVATANRRLIAYLKLDPVGRLSAARAAFEELGLARIAQRLDDAIIELRRVWSQQHASVSMTRLETDLPSSRDRLDELLACFAAKYAERRPNRSPVAAPAPASAGVPGRSE